MTTTEMLTKLIHSKNEVIAEKALRILQGKTTIEDERKIAGSFFSAVLAGDYGRALLYADQNNLKALTSTP